MYMVNPWEPVNSVSSIISLFSTLNAVETEEIVVAVIAFAFLHIFIFDKFSSDDDDFFTFAMGADQILHMALTLFWFFLWCCFLNSGYSLIIYLVFLLFEGGWNKKWDQFINYITKFIY